MISLDATSLPRFMACRGSVDMEAAHPPLPDADDTVRDEGNAFHKLAEIGYAGGDIDALVNTKAYNGVLITAEMAQHAHEYLALLQGVGGGIEHETTWRADGIEVRGRADFISYNSQLNELLVVDAKYGYREVSPEMNWTLISHAVGWRTSTSMEGVTVRLMIYQPRAFHPDGPVRSWTMALGSLTYAYKRIEAQATIASALTTNSHCYGCKAAATCPALRSAAAGVLEVTSKSYADTMSGSDLSRELQLMDRAEALVKVRRDALVGLATHRIGVGQVVDGYGVQTTQGNRTWASHLEVNDFSEAMGVDLRKSGWVTPAEAERRGLDPDLVAMATYRPTTGRKLTKIDIQKVATRAMEKSKT
jgi:Protein of unknown function (DUF2800)